MFVSEVCGRKVFYPADEFTDMLCMLLEQKTLTIDNMRVLQDHGYKIQAVGCVK